MTSLFGWDLPASPPQPDLPPLPSYTLTPVPSLIPNIPDPYFALALPVISYWIVSIIFHIFDEYDLFPQYRLHTPAEILARNRVSRSQVVKTVLFQQVVQTIVGAVAVHFEPAALRGMEEYDVAVWGHRIRYAQSFIPVILAALGVNAGKLSAKFGITNPSVLGLLAGGRYPSLTQPWTDAAGIETTAPAFARWELDLAKAMYWLVIPAIQLFVATIILDTWQYFWHRAMHLNKWMYIKFHSHHHRLYVPYAYGALYNHPFEGFIMDTVGSLIAYIATGMTTRQTMIFFTLGSIKTVDDHCGYALPWDPLQHISSNNAAYHDIHHQSWGIKTNFSQPFFIFWDIFMNTKWNGDVKLRYANDRAAAEKKMEMLARGKGVVVEKDGQSQRNDDVDGDDLAVSAQVTGASAEQSPSSGLSQRPMKSNSNVQDSSSRRVVAPSPIAGGKENVSSSPSSSRRPTKTNQSSSIPDGLETLTNLAGRVRGKD